MTFRFWFTRLVLVCLGLWFLAWPAQAETGRLSSGQTIYVPVYSHIYYGNREGRILLAVTLSIRNVDPRQAITLTKVDYHGSDGKLIEAYLKEPLRLDPLAAIRYIVKESDVTGGSGASFIVSWKSDAPVLPALIQGVMIGTSSTQGISFLTEGRVTEERGDYKILPFPGDAVPRNKE